MGKKDDVPTHVLRVPSKHKDGEWQTKILVAKRARTEAQRKRQGKPLTLTTRRTFGG